MVSNHLNLNSLSSFAFILWKLWKIHWITCFIILMAHQIYTALHWHCSFIHSFIHSLHHTVKATSATLLCQCVWFVFLRVFCPCVCVVCVFESVLSPPALHAYEPLYKSITYSDKVQVQTLAYTTYTIWKCPVMSCLSYSENGLINVVASISIVVLCALTFTDDFTASDCWTTPLPPEPLSPTEHDTMYNKVLSRVAMNHIQQRSGSNNNAD